MPFSKKKKNAFLYANSTKGEELKLISLYSSTITF